MWGRQKFHCIIGTTVFEEKYQCPCKRRYISLTRLFSCRYIVKKWNYIRLKIKTFSLGSRIQDVEVGGLKNHNFLPWGCSLNMIESVKGFMRLLSNFYYKLFSIKWLLNATFGPSGVFLAPNSLHEVKVKKNYAHFETYRILNKFSEIKYSLGCMVWPSVCQILMRCNSK